MLFVFCFRFPPFYHHWCFCFFSPPNRQRCQKMGKKRNWKSFLFELRAEMQVEHLPSKLWIAPYWRVVVLSCICLYTYRGMFLLIVFIFLVLLEDVTISSSGNVMDLKQGYDFAYWCQVLRHNWLSHRRLQRDDFIMQQTQNESRWSCKTSQTDLQEWIVFSAERKKKNLYSIKQELLWAQTSKIFRFARLNWAISEILSQKWDKQSLTQQQTLCFSTHLKQKLGPDLNSSVIKTVRTVWLIAA